MALTKALAKFKQPWVAVAVVAVAVVAVAVVAVWLYGRRESYFQSTFGVLRSFASKSKGRQKNQRNKQKECGRKPSAGCDGVYKCNKDGDNWRWRCKTKKEYEDEAMERAKKDCEDDPDSKWEDNECKHDSAESRCKSHGAGYYLKGTDRCCRKETRRNVDTENCFDV